MRNVDVTVVNDGTIWLFHLHTDEAREWWEANVEITDWNRFAPSSFAVEHRCAPAILGGMEHRGLRWRGVR